MESVAAATLDTLSEVEVFLPRTVRCRKEQLSAKKPLFPGYFFAKFDPIVHMRNVNYARGVSYVVKRKGIPVPMPPQAMNELRLMSPEGILEIPDKTHQVGDKVKIISGLFKGGNGKVTKLIPTRERVKVLFEILGHNTEVEINEDSLEFPYAHPMSTT